MITINRHDDFLGVGSVSVMVDVLFVCVFVILWFHVASFV